MIYVILKAILNGRLIVNKFCDSVNLRWITGMAIFYLHHLIELLIGIEIGLKLLHLWITRFIYQINSFVINLIQMKWISSDLLVIYKL